MIKRKGLKREEKNRSLKIHICYVKNRKEWNINKKYRLREIIK